MINKYIKEYIEISGNGLWCEDKAIITPTLAGVMDGATPINIEQCLGYPTQACWFVNSFANMMMNQLLTDSDSFFHICTSITSKLSNQYKQSEPYNSPCSTAAFASQEGDEICIYLIGDCHVYLSLKNSSVTHLSDERVSFFSDKTLLASQAHPNDAQNAIIKQKIENRKHLNKSGGFFAIDLSRDYINGFRKYNYPVSSIKEILLCTDGFARAFIEYELVTPEKFFEVGYNLLEIAFRIKEFEKKNSTECASKCVKKADDISAILIKFN